MSRRAIVLADGDRPSREALDAAWPGWDHDASIVIAADGGARLAQALGLAIDAWVGDGDSLPSDEIADLERRGIPLVRASRDKDESDTELALTMAAGRGATDVTVLGGLGGRRFDHALANVALLAHPAVRGEVRLLDETTRVSLIDAPGPHGRPVRRPLDGRVGDVVSLLPWGSRVEGVSTDGLRYRLADEPLEAGPARGLSNVRERRDAAVTVRRGRLLVLESAATLQP